MQLRLLACIIIAALLISSCGQKNFSGNYSFLVGQLIIATNPYHKSKSKGLFSINANKVRVMGLAPVKIKLQKNGKEYKGQLSMTRLQEQTMTGMIDDTSEVSFEMKNFMIYGDTLNFLVSADLPLLGNKQFKGFLINGKENILGIQKDIIDKPECFEQNPAFIGKNGQMFLFKELNITGADATRQMAQKYRDCLFEKAENAQHRYEKNNNMEAVEYVDSVLLRTE